MRDPDYTFFGDRNRCLDMFTLPVSSMGVTAGEGELRGEAEGREEVMRKWLLELIEWPGNVLVRSVLALMLEAVIYPYTDFMGFFVWMLTAVLAINLAAWLFGPRSGSNPA